jgi:hypothetical protein
MYKRAMIFLLIVLSILISSQTAIGKEIGETPIVKKAFACPYPTIALVARISGKVIIEVEIDEQGFVKSAKTIEGHVLLNSLAEISAKKWVFNSMENKPQRTAQIIYNFIIVPFNGRAEDYSPVFISPNEFEIRDRMLIIQTQTLNDPKSKSK